MIEGVDKIKTTLDDNASIYQGADKRTTKEKWQAMDKAEKWQFFKDYILAKVIGIIAGIGLLTWFIISVFVTNKERVLEVAMLSTPLDDTMLSALSEEVGTALGLDPDRQEVLLDNNYSLAADEVNTRIKLMAVSAAGDLDCIIMPVSELAREVNAGAASAIEESESILKPELLARLKPFYIYMVPEIEDEQGELTKGEKAAYAIDVTQCMVKRCGYDLKTQYCLMIMTNTSRPEAVNTFIECLFSE